MSKSSSVCHAIRAASVLHNNRGVSGGASVWCPEHVEAVRAAELCMRAISSTITRHTVALTDVRKIPDLIEEGVNGRRRRESAV